MKFNPSKILSFILKRKKVQEEISEVSQNDSM